MKDRFNRDEMSYQICHINIGIEDKEKSWKRSLTALLQKSQRSARRTYALEAALSEKYSA